MARLGEFLRKILFSFQRSRLDRDLEEEMRDHLRRKTEKNIAAGMPPNKAYQAAQRQLGNLTRQREESRSNWGFSLLEDVVQDLRYGFRGLKNAPGFSGIAVLTLALGIGATTAIFSIANAVALRPLAFKDSNRLVHIWGESSLFPAFKMGISYPDIEELKAQSRSFETIASFRKETLVLTGAGEPEQISASQVSADFFRLLSIEPLLGSGFQPGDYELKNGHVVLLSYALWQRRFGKDANIIGRTVSFDRVPYTVAGILPRGFTYSDEEAWVPLVVDAKEKLKRENWMFLTLAKLKPSATIRSAQAELDSFQAGLVKAYPKEESDGHLEVMPLLDAAVGQDTKMQLATLAGAVSFLLLIACANVSNLVLSRSVQRQREIAVRSALGASRSRILRQLLIESLVLALAGGLAGVLVAALGIKGFRGFSPASFSRLNEVRMEPVVAAIALAVSCLAGILCGVAPALHISRPNLNLALKERSASASFGRRFSLRNFLVVSEMALALALLTGSALLVQSFLRLMKVDTGFRTDHLLTAEVVLGQARYPSEDSRRLYIQRLLETLRAEPQFKGVALSNSPLLTHMMSAMAFDPELIGVHEKPTTIEAKSVSPAFFETMNIPVLAGRSFNDRDAKGSAGVVVISQSLAKRFFGGQDAVGKMFKLGPDATDVYQIVGVVADTRDINLNQKLELEIYFPILQDAWNGVNIMVRSSGDPLTLVRLLQQRVWSVDKDEPLTHVNSLSDVIAQSVAEPRFRTWLLSAFAGAGLLLSLIGIYGVISYSVNQRAREMGIRMALGSPARKVLVLVLSQGIALALIGVAAGLLGSLALMRVLTSQLYGIRPSDPLTFAGSALLMLLVAACAAYVPAQRATKVEPVIVLRNE